MSGFQIQISKPSTHRSLPRTLVNETTPSTTIAVIAEHALVRAGLRQLLAERPGFRVIGEAPDVRSLLCLGEQLQPDVLLLSRPISAAATRDLTSALPRACIVCLDDGAKTRDSRVTAIPPETDVEQLCSVLDSALGGRCAGCAFRSRCPVQALGTALTPREQQVAVSVAQGMSSKQIAGALGIALSTVNTYRERLAKKIGASSGAVVTRYVLENALIEE